MMNELHNVRRISLARISLARISLALLSLAAGLLPGFIPATAWAQTPDEQPPTRGIQIYLPFAAANDGAAPAADTADRGAQPAGAKLLVDTDPGVDDAVALIWLAGQARIKLLGVVTVAGNTSITNTTNNAVTILQKAGRQDVTVVMGAAAPLVQPLSKTSYFIHGPDGLWFLGLQNPHDLSGLNTDAPGYYCHQVQTHPGLTLLALGPLTNIAGAVHQCPETMRQVGRLIILGGAKAGGNKTPVAEFNFRQDPEAAEIVLAAGMPVTLVLLEAFTGPTISQKDLDKLFAKGSPAVQFLAPALQQYAAVQIANTGRAGIPDAVAAALVLHPAAGDGTPALVRIVLEQSLARGQSVVGLTPNERIAMLAGDAELSALAERAFAFPPDPTFDLSRELGAILMRAADNAQVVMKAQQDLLTRLVFPGLTAR